MVGWQRHLQLLLRQVGKRVEHNYTAVANFSSSPSSLMEAPILPGKLPYLQRLWKSSSANIPRPFYQFLQQSGISSSRKLLADSSETPIQSPLSPALTPQSSGKTVEKKKAASNPSNVQDILKGIKQSPMKVNLVAALVCGMCIEDALLQLQVTVKQAAKTVYQLRHLLERDFFKKRVAYHAKGRAGVKVRPESRLTVVVRETIPAEEAKIARLRAHNFRKLTKREKRLVPHKLIETTPIWNRKGRAANHEPSGMAA